MSFNRKSLLMVWEGPPNCQHNQIGEYYSYLPLSCTGKYDHFRRFCNFHCMLHVYWWPTLWGLCGGMALASWWDAAHHWRRRIFGLEFLNFRKLVEDVLDIYWCARFGKSYILISGFVCCYHYHSHCHDYSCIHYPSWKLIAGTGRWFVFLRGVWPKKVLVKWSTHPWHS